MAQTGRQYVITISPDFRGTFTGRVDDGTLVLTHTEGQPEPEVEVEEVPLGAEAQRVDNILRRLANYSAETREVVLDTYHAAVEAGWDVQPPKRGNRAHLWLVRGNTKMGLNSASLSVHRDHNPDEVVELAATLPGATWSGKRRVNLSRKRLDLARALETLGR
jgi:hypothetical protein